MSVKSPSKFLSIEFLQGLAKNRYLSENTLTGEFKEYSSIEVDSLLNEKLNKQGENFERQADKLEYEARIEKTGILKPIRGEKMSKRIKGLLSEKQSEIETKKFMTWFNEIVDFDYDKEMQEINAIVAQDKKEFKHGK